MASPQAVLAESQPHQHLVQFFDADEQLLEINVSHYLWTGLQRGEGLLVIAAPERVEAFAAGLKRLGSDSEAAVRDGQLIFCDAQATLDRFMVSGQPHWELFESTIGCAVRELQAKTKGDSFRAYGEMVGLLWKAGQYSAAIRLEQFWNKLLNRFSFSLLCGYPIDVFGHEFHGAGLDSILCAHTHVLPSGTNLDKAVNQAMEEVLGPKVESVTRLTRTDHRPSWGVIPQAEATILWIRNNLPHEAEEILPRARQLYRGLPDKEEVSGMLPA